MRRHIGLHPLLLGVWVFLGGGATCSATDVNVGPPPPPGQPKIDLAISATADKDSAQAGDGITFTASVTNFGPITATTVTAGDTLPTGLTYVTSSTTSGTYDSSTGIWLIDSLPKDSVQTLTLNATMGSGTAGAWLVNRAGVLAAEADSVIGNNVAADSVRRAAVSPPPPPGDSEPDGAGVTFAELGTGLHTAPALDLTHGIYDSFDHYASVIAMLSTGNCPAGTDGYGVPDAWTTYGYRTRPDMGGGVGSCSLPSGASTYSLVTGRGGTGKAVSNHLTADPGKTQVNTPKWTPNWGNQGVTQSFAYSDSLTIVFQIWFKGTGPGLYYGKWFEMWYNGGSNPGGRIELGIWNTHRNPSWVVNNNAQDRVGSQPLGPYPDNVLTDNQWHRMTIAYKPNSSGYGANPSSRDGLFRTWIDGTKIVDISASTMDVTPPGGAWAWTTGHGDNSTDVGAGLDYIPSGIYHQIAWIVFPALANYTTNQLDLAWDDLKIWCIR